MNESRGLLIISSFTILSSYQLAESSQREVNRLDLHSPISVFSLLLGVFFPSENLLYHPNDLKDCIGKGTQLSVVISVSTIVSYENGASQWVAENNQYEVRMLTAAEKVT